MINSARGLAFYSITTTSDCCNGIKGRVAFDGIKTNGKEIIREVCNKHNISADNYTINIKNIKNHCSVTDETPVLNYTHLEIDISANKISDVEQNQLAMTKEVDAIFCNQNVSLRPLEEPKDKDVCNKMARIAFLCGLSFPISPERNSSSSDNTIKKQKCCLCTYPLFEECASSSESVACYCDHRKCHTLCHSECFEYCAMTLSSTPGKCPVCNGSLVILTSSSSKAAKSDIDVMDDKVKEQKVCKVNTNNIHNKHDEKSDDDDVIIISPPTKKRRYID